ncbi:MAG: TetR/AcrR family transcriptional regulator [Aeromicrobium sp.]
MVLDAALEVLLAHGYPGTTMSAIALAAGVTKPVVYECFDNKDDVLRSLLKREEQRLLDGVEAALPKELDFTNLPLLLEASYTAFFSAALDTPDSWRLVFETQRGIPDSLANRIRRAREVIAGQIKQMVAQFLSTRESAHIERESAAIAEILVSVAESGARVLLTENVKDDPWTPETLASFVVEGLLNTWV